MERLTAVQKAAQLLGGLGGKKTLEKHGIDKLREWGKTSSGRPRKPWDELSESGKRERRRQERLRRGEG